MFYIPDVKYVNLMKTLIWPVFLFVCLYIFFCHQRDWQMNSSFGATNFVGNQPHLDFNKPLTPWGLEAKQVPVLCEKNSRNIGEGAKEKQRERTWLGCTSQNLICAMDTHSNEFIGFFKRSPLVPKINAKESCYVD